MRLATTSTTLRQRCKGLAIIAMTLTSFARAQTPNLTGHVQTPAGVPIPGVEVRLDDSDRLSRTDERGAFAFVGAPAGGRRLLLRRIGYLPAALNVHVPEVSDTLSVTMVPVPSALDTVKVTAHLNVLAGIVVDSANRPVSGASVDVMGARSASTTTDSAGWFTFTSVRSGSVVLRIRKAGYTQVTHSLALADWRGLMLRLPPLDRTLSESRRLNASGYGNSRAFAWAETNQRLSERGTRAVIVSREELAPFDDQPLGQAVRNSKSGGLATAGLITPYSDEVCVLLDGRRVIGSTSMDTFRTSEIQFVELYPPGTESSGTVAQAMRGAGCRATRAAGARSREPFYAVIWMRS